MNLAAVQNFFKSYELSVQQGDVDAMVAHYAEPFTGIANGGQMHYPTRADAKANSEAYLARLHAHPLGLTNMSVVDVSFTAVSDSFVLTFPVWEVRPRGQANWHFRNVYGLRQHGTQLLAELAIADNEGANMMTRYPELFR